ncbi:MULTISPECIES: baseplate J/gp47 family protein [unclassified Acinetobacter]|uniref:baseplate J/gp47 family protein n=1 Tax=unclassified Acinetobacter TaxID=196816 RepID=UPI00190D4C1E|nr:MULTISPECIES: baseplate J/gp47 family protein [unclassified Acinetobacter]MBK0062375.1 baseplate J/gp47 family protein [Acinetobacter sp. S55]MBK0066179.1 baseplate J/gp47 family protein [Acinetobacter sp. S54]
MSFSIPTYNQIRQLILQEVRNLTGITAPDDSDAAIRADGEAAVVEGLYQHQKYIERQLFISTADEPYLYVHAERLGLPRLAGTFASGNGKAISNANLTISNAAKVTDGKGHYWTVTSSISLQPNIEAIIEILADQAGVGWNYSGTSLMWVAPEAGLSSTVSVISLNGGTDQEDLEDWRARLLEREQLGLSRDRESDLKAKMKDVPGVGEVYVYPKRRGLGSMDVAITAKGTPPTLPSSVLIASAQAALDGDAGFWADCLVYSPTEQVVPVTAIITGSNVDLDTVRQVIRDYFAEIAPAESYQWAILSARILEVDNVTDVQLSPSSNIVPEVNWMYTKWLRLGTLSVSAA